MDKKQTNTKTDTGYAILHDLVINATREKVFEAVSKPEHLVNWWPKSCSGSPVLGSEYNFYFGPEYDWYGKVSQLEPGRFYYRPQLDCVMFTRDAVPFCRVCQRALEQVIDLYAGPRHTQ